MKLPGKQFSGRGPKWTLVYPDGFRQELWDSTIDKHTHLIKYMGKIFVRDQGQKNTIFREISICTIKDITLTSREKI